MTATPERAARLEERARAGELMSMMPTAPTIMAMLECYRPSLIAWRILEKIANGFITVSENLAKDAMRRLANRRNEPLVAGESGAAGFAGLLAATTDRKM